MLGTSGICMKYRKYICLIKFSIKFIAVKRMAICPNIDISGSMVAICHYCYNHAHWQAC